MENDLWRPTYCNCLFWACWACLVDLGDIRFQSSVRWEHGFHCYVETPEGAKVSYDPVNKTPISFWQGFKAVFFKGEVVIEFEFKGDDDAEEKE